jgi:hypothetical protein
MLRDYAPELNRTRLFESWMERRDLKLSVTHYSVGEEELEATVRVVGAGGIRRK